MSRLRHWMIRLWMGWGLVVALTIAVPGPFAVGQTASSTGASSGATQKPASPAAVAPASDDATGGLIIEPAELPPTYPRGPYHIALHVHGNYVPVLHWTVEGGGLPPGIKLDDNGTLSGQAQRAGEFRFVLTVRDGDKPQKIVRKEMVLKVVDAIQVVWKVLPHVNVSRIEGSVEVSNTTADDIDLTFDVKAVAENGRATEIGYQHFALTRGTVGMTLPFGENLPHGGYLVRVDVTGEIAKTQAIYKTALQTPAPLQVVPGP